MSDHHIQFVCEPERGSGGSNWVATAHLAKGFSVTVTRPSKEEALFDLGIEVGGYLERRSRA